MTTTQKAQELAKKAEAQYEALRNTLDELKYACANGYNENKQANPTLSKKFEEAGDHVRGNVIAMAREMRSDLLRASSKINEL